VGCHYYISSIFYVRRRRSFNPNRFFGTVLTRDFGLAVRAGVRGANTPRTGFGFGMGLETGLETGLFDGFKTGLETTGFGFETDTPRRFVGACAIFV
jgi:hypothetical protein